MTDNVSDTLNLAADLIEERGWTVGGSGWGSGTNLCLEGGVMAALGFSGMGDPTLKLNAFWSCPAYVAVADYLGCDLTLSGRDENSMTPTDPLWRWNDQHGTETRVIEVLRATALIEAARERQTAEVTA